MSADLVSLPEDLDRFVEERVASGAFPDRGSVLRAGVARLRDEADSEAQKLANLRAKIEVGLAQLDRGEAVRVTDVAAWLDTLGRGRGAPS